MGPKQIFNKLSGRASFEVDESFVFEQIGDQVSDEDKELMNMFVEQSQDAQEKLMTEAADKASVGGAYYRICDVPTKQCDDSPLEAIEHPDRITSRKKSVFGHGGQMIRTDGTGKNTKLSKVYKRHDNRGALLKALKRMKLNA